MADARLGIDVGGTFTDLVALVDGELVTAKVPSTPEDQSEGAMRAVEAAGCKPGDVAVFAHGMTVATNALLERRGARTALVTTEGFRDVLEIARPEPPLALRPDAGSAAGPRPTGAAVHRSRADGAGRRGRAAGRGRRGARRGGPARRRRGGGRGVPAVRLPPSRARARRRRCGARRPAGGPRLAVQRGPARSSANTNASPRPPPTRICLPGSPHICGTSPSAPRRPESRAHS